MKDKLVLVRVADVNWCEGCYYQTGSEPCPVTINFTLKCIEIKDDEAIDYIWQEKEITEEEKDGNKD